MKEFSLAKLAGLQIIVTPAAVLGTLLLWAVFAWASGTFLELSAGPAVWIGLVATGLHWLADFAHQLGHAWMARRVGYPMTGVRLGMWLIFSTSQYPGDEPELPVNIHVRRALGGPAASLLISAATGLVAWIFHSLESPAWWLVVFFSLENLVTGLGAFLPVGFTDGSTLIRIWRQR